VVNTEGGINISDVRMQDGDGSEEYGHTRSRRLHGGD